MSTTPTITLPDLFIRQHDGGYMSYALNAEERLQQVRGCDDIAQLREAARYRSLQPSVATAIAHRIRVLEGAA
ncbi:MAG: hypothetical protein Q4G62_01515 [Pseudomonadota bacterium]|nr:hypothetical protein [Pseudomonadota bacterium]